MNRDSNLPEGGYSTRARGVTHDGRQDKIDPSLQGMKLIIAQDKNNRHDQHAVGIWLMRVNRDGKWYPDQLGFLRSEIGFNDVVWNLLEDGWDIQAICTKVFDGEDGLNKGFEFYMWDDDEPLEFYLKAGC